MSLEYAEDLFDAETVAGLGRHYVRLLEAMVAEPSRALGELEMLNAQERTTELTAWNPTPEAEMETTIHGLFETQAALCPDVIAVVDERQTLSYGGVESRANQLAHLLLELGVVAESRVALCLPRSSDWLVSLLGVMKAGAVYVPLDPSHPDTRLAYQVEDSGAVLVVAASNDRERFAQSQAVLCLDTEVRRVASQPTESPGVVVDPEQLGYVIYTSGSTGRPKGVGVPHRGAVNLHEWLRGLLTEHPRPRWGWNANYAFDASLQAIVSLGAGATLCVLPESVRADPQQLELLLADLRVTIWDATPAQMEMLLRLDPGPLPSVLVGGEAISPSLWEMLGTHYAGRSAKAFNVYGPTECSVDSTVCEIVAGTQPSLGRPVRNIRAHVLDTRGATLVPPGGIGELYIGGSGVVRGYLGRSELTAERFVPDPFSSVPGSRLYRTGDRVRRRLDGGLEFLGRLDEQVKLRGYRIELGEVESRLREQAGVGQALALVREDQPGDQRLVAYVLSEDGASLDSEWLASALSRQLPGYMVPSAIVTLAEFPLTANGKIDRKALPVPERPELGQVSGGSPETTEEQLLAEIWEELLDVSPVGRHDSFFTLGGHSLLAIKLLARIEQVFNIRLAPVQIFLKPTIAGIASLLNPEKEPSPYESIVLRRGQADAAILVCIPGLGGNASDFAELAPVLDWEGDVIAIQPYDLQPGEILPDSIEAMAEQYLRVVGLQEQREVVLAGHSMGGLVALEMAARMRDKKKPLACVLLDTQAPPLPDAPMRPLPDQVDALLLYYEQHGGRVGRLDASALHQLPPKERLLAVLDALDQGSDQKAGHAALSQRIIDVYTRHLRAAASYRGPVDTAPISPRIVHVSPFAQQCEASAWAPHLETRLERFQVAGDHWTMLHRRHAQGLAGAMRAAIGPDGRCRDAHAAMKAAAIPKATPEQRLAHADADMGGRWHRMREAFEGMIAARFQRAGVRRVLDIGAANSNARLPQISGLRTKRGAWMAEALGLKKAATSAPRDYDAIVGLGNGYSVLDQSELADVVSRAFASLRPRGMLILDLPGPGAINRIKGDRVHIMASASGCHAVLETPAETGWTRVAAEVVSGGELASVHAVELHVQTPEEISASLIAHGFTRVEVLALDGNAPAERDEKGLLLIAERES
ncbi:non-ribosomal peptide synthetase [Microbulbifer halophilus]|uniref:non-ribosomal peptide synthetase n=1 Tax=Microbulbifer halophilus TaxID=453963 RepID=UPI0036316150